MAQEAIHHATMRPVRDRPGFAAANAGLQHGRLWMSILLFGFYAIGLAFKSFLFVNGEPVAVSYVFNAVFIGSLLAGLLFLNRLMPISKSVAVMLMFAIVWALISSAVSGIFMNYAATFAMLVMLAGCFYAAPVSCLVVGFEPWRLVNHVTIATVIISFVMLLVAPNMAIDAESGRFSGVFISVAVACNFFFFGTVLSFAAAMRSKTDANFYFYVAAAVLSFALLYITRTRSVLIEGVFCVMVLAAFTPMRRGMKMILIAAAGWLLVLGIFSGTAVSTGLVRVDEQLEEFRLADRSLTDSRDRNWDFGFERIGERPLFGEGLLAKQTEGGTRDIDLAEGGSYNQTYDPHSLPLSLSVEGGIPFMVAVMGAILLVMGRFIRRFGIVRSLQSPDFVLVATHLPVMVFAGGDLTTLGNMVEKTFWILLGALEIKNSLVAPGDPRYARRPTLSEVLGGSSSTRSHPA